MNVVLFGATGFTGVVARWEPDGLVLRGGTGLERIFLASPGGFDVEGRAVTLVRPRPVRPRADGPALTASGSVAVAGQRARGARLFWNYTGREGSRTAGSRFHPARCGFDARPV